MRIRISLPEDRDYAGWLEVLDASGAVVLAPVPAAGRAHDEPAAAHGNPSRSPLLAYGDTPTGVYVVVASATDGVVVLEPVSGQAALADAHGRFRLLIQGGGGNGALRATAGAVRLLDRDQAQLLTLLQGFAGRVLCEIVATTERGAKVDVTAAPLEPDPPPLAERADVIVQPTRAATLRQAHAGGGSARRFVMSERSGSSGGTAYGGGDVSGGDVSGGDTGDVVGAGSGSGTPDQSGDTGVAAPGADLEPPPDDPTVTADESGASQLLSTAAPTGLPDPYSPVEGGWIVGPAPVDPYTNAAGGEVDPFVGRDVDSYTGTTAALGDTNAFTGGSSVDAFSGQQNGGNSGSFPFDVSQMLASNGPLPQGYVAVTDNQSAAGSDSPDSPLLDNARLVDNDQLTDDNGRSLLRNQPIIDKVDIDGESFDHYQVNIGGKTYDVYSNELDPELVGKSFLVPAATQPTNPPSTTGPSTTGTLSGDPSTTVTPPTGAPPAGAPPAANPSDPSQQLPPDGYASNFPPTPFPSLTPSPSPSNAPTASPPPQPLSGLVSAIPGGLGVGSTATPGTNLYYRGLNSDYDPSIPEIVNGADLTPIPFKDPFQPPATPAEGTFRHMRASGNVLPPPGSKKPGLGTDRISVAENLDAYRDGGRLAGRYDDLVRIDIDKARELGADFYDNPEILDHFESLERDFVEDLQKLRAEGREGTNKFKDAEGRLNALRRAQERAAPDFFGEGEFVNRVPSGAISEVRGASVAEAAAREANFLGYVEDLRGLGNRLLILGVALSAERIITAPEEQRDRVAGQEAGGWAFSFAGAETGAELGVAAGGLFGLETTGPGAIVTGGLGGLAGGVLGFIFGQEYVDRLNQSIKNSFLDDEEPVGDFSIPTGNRTTT